MGTVFKAFGHFIPDRQVTNKELAERFSITEEWIEERTGILERRYYDNGATSDMVVDAVTNYLSNNFFDKQQIDCIIVATMTPDYHCPSTAAIVQKKLGINHTFAFDVMAACSGFIYALQLADSLIISKKYRTVLVIGADKMSSVIDYKDRKTSLVLSDGAGFCLLEQSETANNIIETVCYLDSSISNSVVIPNGGSLQPIDENTFDEQNHFLRFADKNVFEGGIKLLAKSIEQVLQKAELKLDDIDLIVPHQANKRMIEELAKQLGVSIDKFFINIEQIGNTSAATIPIALSQASQQEKLNGKVLLTSVGAGFTYAASILSL